MEIFSSIPRTSSDTKPPVLTESDIARIDALLQLRLSEHLRKISELVRIATAALDRLIIRPRQ